MNAKSLFACLLIIALVASSAQALMIKKTHDHKKSMHMAKTFAMGVQHRMCDSLHMQFDLGDGETPDFVTDFLTFAMGDTEILNSLMNNQSLSQESADKIKQFFKNNKSFNDMMLQIFQSPETPECMKNLTDAQQRKIISITIDQMDFADLLNGGGDSQSVDPAAEQKVLDAITNDPDLGADVVKCYSDNADAFSQVE